MQLHRLQDRLPEVQMIPTLDEILLRWPHGVASRIRVLYLRALGMKIGGGCRIESVRVRRPSRIHLGGGNALTEGCWLWPPDAPGKCAIRIGERNYFNRDVMLDANELISIGDDNMFGPGVYVTDSNHGIRAGEPIREARLETAAVRIGSDCWIGARAIILSGVEVGDRAVVGAGAVVTRSVDGGTIVAGVPAVRIGTRGEAH
jgi:maltose O-acetyltransferase